MRRKQGDASRSTGIDSNIIEEFVFLAIMIYISIYLPDKLSKADIHLK